MGRCCSFLLLVVMLSGCVPPVRTGTDTYFVPCPVETVLQLNPTEQIDSLAVSADRKVVLTHGAEGVVKLWEYSTGRLLRTIDYGSGIRVAVFLSSDRILLSDRHCRPARIVDVATGVVAQEKNIATGSVESSVESLTVSENGRHLITSNYDGGIRIFNLATGYVEESIFNRIRLTDLQADADARSVVGLDPTNGVMLIDRLANREAGEPQLSRLSWPAADRGQPESKYVAVAISRDGKWVAAADGNNGKIVLWDRTRRKPAGVFQDHPFLKQRMNKLAFNREGTLLAAVSEGGLVVWDMRTREYVYSDTGDYNQVVFVPDQNSLIIIGTNRGREINLDQPALNRELFAPGNVRINDIALSSRGSYFSMSYGPDQALIWYLRDHQPSRRFMLGDFSIRGYPQRIMAIAFSPDENYIIASGLGGLIKGWYTSSGETFAAFQNPTEYITGLSFSPDGKYIISGGTNWAGIWDLSTYSLAREFPPPEGQTPVRSWVVQEIAVDPLLSRLVMGCSPRAPTLYDMNSGEKIRSFGSATGWAVNSCSLSADGRLLGTASNGEGLTIWNCSSGELVKKISSGTFYKLGMWIGPRTILLSRNDSRRFVLYDFEQEREVTEFRGHNGAVAEMLCSPDRQRIISMGSDGTVRFWDAESGQPLGTLMTDEDGNWAIVDRYGRFDYGGKGLDYIHFVVGLETFSPQTYFNQHYYPGLIMTMVQAGTLNN